MPWSQISTASKAAYDADVAGGAAAGKRYMPSTFGVTITQTEKGHPFLAKPYSFLELQRRIEEMLPDAAND